MSLRDIWLSLQLKIEAIWTYPFLTPNWGGASSFLLSLIPTIFVLLLVWGGFWFFDRWKRRSRASVAPIKPSSRFSYCAPGWGLTIWYMMHSDWRARMRAWIVDHEHGERFQLSEDEEVMMQALSMQVLALTNQLKIPLWKTNRFWAERIDPARDRILLAISDRRHGDPSEWEKLKAMKVGEWSGWLRGLGALT